MKELGVGIRNRKKYAANTENLLTERNGHSIIAKVVRNNIRKAGIRLTLAHTVTSGSYKVENDPEMEFPIVYERVV